VSRATGCGSDRSRDHSPASVNACHPRCRSEVLSNHPCVGVARQPQRATKGVSALRLDETLRVEVQVRAPTRQAPAQVGDEHALDRHHA